MVKRKYYRYALYLPVLLLLCVIEGTPGLLPVIYHAKPLLLVSAAVSAAAYESPMFSLFCAVICGFAIDAGSGGVVGFSSMILAVICYYESNWNDKYIKNNIYLILLYSAIASAAVIGMKYFIFCFIPQYDGAVNIFREHYVTRFAYTWAVTPLVNLIMWGTSRTFRKEKRKIRVKKRKRVPPSQRTSASRRRAKKTDY